MTQASDLNRLYAVDKILQHLKKHGESSDNEIAEATGIPLTDLHLYLAELKTKNHIMLCHSTKFIEGVKIESVICRISGYIPPNKPGVKPKIQTA